MSRRNKSLTIEAKGQGNINAIEIDIAYEEGGYNWYNGQTTSRGIFVRIIPTEIRDMGEYKTRVTQLGAGGKTLMKELNRFSQKALDSCSFSDELVKETLHLIARRYNIEILDKDWA